MKKMTKTWAILALVGSILIVSCKKDHPEDIDKLSNKVILEWNLVALQAEGGPTYQHPLLASRINAMVHIAMHDALNAISPRYEQYIYKTHGAGWANPFSAAASAAHTVLLGSFPENKAML